jgi:hypothetical protein
MGHSVPLDASRKQIAAAASGLSWRRNNKRAAGARFIL